MSNISPKGSTSTSNENAALTALAALGTTPAGQAITKTGSATFANASPESGVSQFIVSLTVGFSNADYIATGTNDQVTVQAAVDAAMAAGGGSVYIKAGTYNFTAGVVKSLGGKDLRIRGDGLATIINNNSTTADAAHSTFAITGSSAIGGEFLEISDLTLIGNTTCGMGLRLSQIYQGRLLNIVATDFKSAAGWGVGMWLDNIIDFEIVNPVLRRCLYSGMQMTSQTNANQIIGGWLESNSTTGLAITGPSKKNVFLGTVFQTNTTYGVNITGSAEGTTFIGCWVENQANGIQTAGTNTVIDNTRFDTSGTADVVVATGAVNTEIINCSFQSTASVITLASGVDQVTIKDNWGLTTITDNGATNIIFSNKGNTGLGTVTPRGVLHVLTADAGTIVVASPTNAAGASTGIEFKYGTGTTSGNQRIAQILGFTQTGGGGDILFQTASAGNAAYSTKMTLKQGGELDVNGNIYAVGGDIKQSGSTVIRNVDNPLYLQTDTANDIIFRSSVTTELMRIQAGGSVGIGTASPSSLFSVGSSSQFQINTSGKEVKYNGVTTVGWGQPAIYGFGRVTAQVAAAAAFATYTVGAADGSFLISANLLVTASVTNSFTCTCTYTDEGNTSRTLNMTFSQITGTLLTTITNVTGTGAYEGVPLHIRAKASTAITFATVGTFTSVTYNAEAQITQIA